MPAPILEVASLTVSIASATGRQYLLRGVDLSLDRDEVLGVVGESGSGKTVTMLAILGLLPGTVRVTGSIRFEGRELLGLPNGEMRRFRGGKIGMIFQEPRPSLNPVIPVGDQIIEGIRAHQPAVARRQAGKKAVELLGLTGVPDPHRRMRDYPHQLSGGLCQRVMIAMSLANDPDVLIADEPTTALDVTIQAQILELIHRVRTERGLCVVLISHDLGVVAGLADRVSVLYAGRVVEQGDVRDIYRRAHHPYTRGLLASIPRLTDKNRRPLTSFGGAAPSLRRVTPGCAFQPRCPHAATDCVELDPRLRPVGPVQVACHYAEEIVRSISGRVP